MLTKNLFLPLKNSYGKPSLVHYEVFTLGGNLKINENLLEARLCVKNSH